jgi:serine/threonine-protein kinase
MATSATPPDRLGRYELVARLASGGMGEIFLARLQGAAGFEKLCVIKRILPHLADDPRFREMLIGEARIASMMAHGNICQVHELGETDGQLYIVMEYLEGLTLLPLLRKLSKERGQLELGFVAGVLHQAADGLHYAHELRDRTGELLGIVHRDVTPSNLFITDAGIVKVLDFGIAKVKNASAHTQTGTVKGKYAYMAPEQLRGAAVDRRADVFALGVAVYEMLALRRLFQRKTDYLTFRAVMEQPIMDIRHYRPDVPDALALALTRALEREPANRYESARQFGGAVLDAVGPVQRPWTQGEIGDFVRLAFAGDISRRETQIANAVRDAHDLLPLIETPDQETEIDETSTDFPPVDSAIHGTPVETRHLRPTGEPFIESTGPEIEQLRSASQPVVVVQTRRSVVWPMLAVAMVAIAGGALYLVWRQQQAPKQTLVITNEHGQEIRNGSNTLTVEPNTEEAPVARPIEDTPHPAPKPAGPDPFLQVVKGSRALLSKCAATHGAPPPGTRVLVLVGADGHTKRVTFTPVTVDTTAIGDCLKGAFDAMAFPRGAGDHAIDIGLNRT